MSYWTKITHGKEKTLIWIIYSSKWGKKMLVRTKPHNKLSANDPYQYNNHCIKSMVRIKALRKCHCHTQTIHLKMNGKKNQRQYRNSTR